MEQSNAGMQERTVVYVPEILPIPLAGDLIDPIRGMP